MRKQARVLHSREGIRLHTGRDNNFDRSCCTQFCLQTVYSVPLRQLFSSFSLDAEVYRRSPMSSFFVWSTHDVHTKMAVNSLHKCCTEYEYNSCKQGRPSSPLSCTSPCHRTDSSCGGGYPCKQHKAPKHLSYVPAGRSLPVRR